jgi:phospholipid/cholesterol/gamma-HCH transport system substrate-binding protein
MANCADLFDPANRRSDFGMKARASNLMIGSTAQVVIAAAFFGLPGIQKIHSVQQRGPLRVKAFNATRYP